MAPLGLLMVMAPRGLKKREVLNGPGHSGSKTKHVAEDLSPEMKITEARHEGLADHTKALGLLPGQSHYPGHLSLQE